MRLKPAGYRYGQKNFVVISGINIFIKGRTLIYVFHSTLKYIIRKLFQWRHVKGPHVAQLAADAVCAGHRHMHCACLYICFCLGVHELQSAEERAGASYSLEPKTREKAAKTSS